MKTPFKYVILNTCDAPRHLQIAQRVGKKYCYISPRFRLFDGMTPSRPTCLLDFGFDITEDGDEVHFEKVRESVATYEDGMIRQWQGHTKFTIIRRRRGFRHYRKPCGEM